MDYLAIPQMTAGWLLGRSELVDALAEDIYSLAKDDSLAKGVITMGPLRVSASRTCRVLAFWNNDYLTGTGAEHWGLMRLSDQYGLLGQPDVLREVLLRGVQITDRRLQGFLLNSAWELRTELAGVTTCIAGGGKAWSKYRIGYVEGEGVTDQSVVRGVLIVGPAWEDNAFRSATLRELNALRGLLPEANTLLTEVTKRPTLEYPSLRLSSVVAAQAPTQTFDAGAPVSLPALDTPATDRVYETLAWRYDDWIAHKERLTATQRVVLEEDIIERQPVRIVGAAGSGKTLLMMLLSIRQMRKSLSSGNPVRSIYIAHNSGMRDKVRARLAELGGDSLVDGKGAQRLEVRTLFDYAQEILGVPDLLLIDRDADASKRYQKGVVIDAIKHVFNSCHSQVNESVLFTQVASQPELLDLFGDLIADEISVAIKGQGMTDSSDRRQYVESERRLSRLHGVLKVPERELIWQVFLQYQADIAVEHGLLDADDLALSLLGRLKTPLWELRRPQQGYDFVFVDEAQLFNENEKRLFPLIAKRKRYVPIAIALDQAQQTRSLTSAGLGALGVDDVSNQTLHAVHRCSIAILKLAFYVIQHTTDLFGADFPDFTRGATARELGDDPMPRIERAQDESATEAAARIVKDLRQRNRRQICVVCFTTRHWNSMRDELRQIREPLRILEGRGEPLPAAGQPLVALARPDAIGGQEFDGVVCVGLEQGVVPLRIHGNESLTAALEQQALREMYLVFTRARSELVIVIDRGGSPNAILQNAIGQNILSDGKRTSNV